MPMNKVPALQESARKLRAQAVTLRKRADNLDARAQYADQLAEWHKSAPTAPAPPNGARPAKKTAAAKVPAAVVADPPKVAASTQPPGFEDA